MSSKSDKELEFCKQRIAILEQELYKSRATWRSFLEYAPQIGISLDPLGRILFANEHFLTLTGWSFQDIEGGDWFDLFLPEYERDKVREVFRETMAQQGVGSHSKFQNEILTRDGQVRSISWFNFLTRDENDRTTDVTSLGVDLTAEEEAKAALQVSQERLALALKASKDAVWEWNVTTGDIFVSSQWYQMLGYSPGNETIHVDAAFHMVHKDDLDKSREITEKSIISGQSYENEVRLKTRSGDWKWVLVRGQVVPKRSKKDDVRIIGTNTDIHDRKLAELAMKEAKEAAEEANKALNLNMGFLRTLVETIPELVWLKDENGVYSLCNRRFERLYGTSEAEIIGKTDYDFVSKDVADAFRKHDRAAMKAGQPTVNEETVTYLSDGHSEELETIKTPMYDDNGKLLGVLGVARDITERNRISSELKESEMRFKTLHNASFGGITIHDKGVILDCNQGLSDISGYSMDELVGMDGLLLIAESSRQLVMGNILKGYDKPYEAVAVRKNGEEYPVRLEGKNIPYKGREARVVEFRDITRRKKAESRLRDSELRHRVIFEKSPLGMVRLSEEGLVLDCNDHFVALWGVPRERLIGTEAEDRNMRAAVDKALNGAPSTFEGYHYVPESDRKNYLRARFNPVNIGRSPTEVIATVEDFSERKEARDRLRKAKEEAEAYSRSKTEFLANMSHEIRTPLNGLSGMLELMLDTGLNEEQAGYAQNAIQSSRRLTRLLTDILDLSRVEAGKLIMRMAPFDLREAFEQVMDLYRPTAEQTGVELRTSMESQVPNHVLGDSLRIQQVLTNLIGNSYKFTDTGYVSVSAQTIPSRANEESRVLFVVSDTGTGIPDENVGTLFESFTQVSQGYARQHQGAGLGLAICRQLVDLMDGSITIETEVGVGTNIYVAVPFSLSDAPSTKPRSSSRTMETGERVSLKVLLAEDERVNSLVTSRLLEKAGHQVTVVENGRQAIDMITDGEFDVVLMDIQMPVMDGVAATKALREGAAGEKGRTIPIAAVTAFAMTGDREKFLEAGMDGYVEKPIALDKLHEFLDEVTAK